MPYGGEIEWLMLWSLSHWVSSYLCVLAGWPVQKESADFGQASNRQISAL